MEVDTIPQNGQAVLDQLNGQNLAPASERIQPEALGQADFFKLLTTQLANQDPLEPMDDTAFIAQMAQFSALEMQSKLNTKFEDFTADQQFQSAQGMIGKKVSLLHDGGQYIEGTAQAVEKDGEDIRVFVDGIGYDIAKVFRVDAPPAPPPVVEEAPVEDDEPSAEEAEVPAAESNLEDTLNEDELAATTVRQVDIEPAP